MIRSCPPGGVASNFGRLSNAYPATPSSTCIEVKILLWLVSLVGPEKFVFHARNFLKDLRRHLMGDDFSGYKKLFTEKRGITELGCWTHARWKFFDPNTANKSPIAAEALARIGELYAIERESWELDEKACAVLSQDRSRPLLAAPLPMTGHAPQDARRSHCTATASC